jgi:hypothetical protein
MSRWFSHGILRGEEPTQDPRAGARPALAQLADTDGVTASQRRRSLELFQSDVAPVLSERIPSRPLRSQLAPKEVVT